MYIWQKGDLQKGYYHSKNHAPSHHRTVRPIYLHFLQRQHSSHLQGCVNLDLGPLDMHKIKTGAQKALRQIIKYSQVYIAVVKDKQKTKLIS